MHTFLLVRRNETFCRSSYSHTPTVTWRREGSPVPRDVRSVVVEAHDKIHGLGGATVTVDLLKLSGPNFRRGAR
jgi:hypothetical protein